MRHRMIGRKLGRNPSHQRALLRNLAIALIMSARDVEDYDEPKMAPKVPGRIITTLMKAKEVRPFIEKCITVAIKARKVEKTAELLESKAEKNSAAWKTWREGEGWKEWNAVASKALAYRRKILQKIGSKEAVSVLFDKVADSFEGRSGGYTRIMKLAKPRLGDGGDRAILEFVGQRDRTNQVAEVPTVE